ncbi:Nucleolar complex-associated protein [Gracilaria domingensis]|nr:Nucleolar complex-associated protein [Gracilaria domingensis]
MTRRRRKKSNKEGNAPAWEVSRRFASQERQPRSLPVVQADGIVKKVQQARPKFIAKAKTKKEKNAFFEQVSSDLKEEEKPETSENINQGEKRSRKRPRYALEKYAEQIEKLGEIKVSIASMASKITANPAENVSLLRELRSMGRESKGKVAALILLTESQVYKDIAPGYRIRRITDKEAETKVSKETKRLRDFEEALLSNYQRFVKSCISLSNWRFSGIRHTPVSRNMTRVRFAACKALSELLRSVPHFNEAEVIATTVCTHVCNQEAEIRKLCSHALSTVLQNAHRASGNTLELCVSIAKNLAKVAGRKKRSAPAELVAPLTEIQFAHFARLPLSSQSKKGESKGSKRLSKVKRRRLMKQEKHAVDEKDVEKDMREADAEATPQELFGAKKTLLDSVCHAYFNIIRAASNDVDNVEEAKENKPKPKKRKPPTALSPALKGLLRISMFISTDVIDAILGALTPLLESGHLPLSSRFRCLSAAYAVLGVHARSQKVSADSFTGDTRALDTALYTAIGALYTSEMPQREDEPITYDAIEAIVASTSFRDMPPARCAALARRLAITATCAPVHSCTIALLYAAQVLMPSSIVSPIFPQFDENNELRMIDDSGLVQTFNMETDDPDIATAERSASWELCSLVNSFHPAAREIAEQCAAGSCGSKLAKSTTSIVFKAKAFSNAQGGFNPPPQTALQGYRKRKRHCVETSPLVLGRQLLPEQDGRRLEEVFGNDETNMEEFLLAQWGDRKGDTQ